MNGVCHRSLLFLAARGSKDNDMPPVVTSPNEWVDSPSNPVLRDLIPAENYQAAGDAHVFMDDSSQLRMIYSGDSNGLQSIKMSTGTSWTDWSTGTAIVTETNVAGSDRSKETPFYRRSATQHQLYYIGYADEATYDSQIFLATADNVDGPYTARPDPVLPIGMIAGEQVNGITSMSVLEHSDGLLYMVFQGWDEIPEVTQIWAMGCESIDDGITWTNCQKVGTAPLTEGQITKRNDGTYVAVGTQDWDEGGKEAIFYATADHPYGPWQQLSDPIKPIAVGKEEAIAGAITVDPATGDEYLYYTEAIHSIGWWINVATPPPTS